MHATDIDQADFSIARKNQLCSFVTIRHLEGYVNKPRRGTPEDPSPKTLAIRRRWWELQQ